ncbi:unnamed protein product [Adineta steineri]|uniref:Membrane-bound transcription factor site-2 protease n=1 Tax=Adineta steineri TaxID=433720 RepID=A0A813NNA8_9BILA|nr:unnamed protein product [Adineta steineri]
MFIRFLLQLAIFWFSIHLFNYLLLRFQATKRSYLRLLRSLGCHISILNITFHTTSFNRLFYRIGSNNSRLWKIWFTLGIFIAFLTAICACLTLIFLPMKYIYDFQQANLFSTSNLTNKNDRDKLLIQPIIPGVNVPLEQLGHFFLALLVCTVFHEFGHAVAATAEQVRLNGCGYFVLILYPGAYVDLNHEQVLMISAYRQLSEQVRLNGCGYFVLILYPGAYVDLNHEQVLMISAYRQLRIYCAGIFHNIVLVLAAVGFLLIHPIFLRHFFIETATVSHIAKNSPISNLLPIHSTIESIDGCFIHTSKDWYQCLRSIRDKHSLQSSGYCLTQAEIQLLSSHIGRNEQVRLNGCGYFVLILYPGAYVDLNHEQVLMISAYRQLRIYCAGIFHNIVLVLVAVAFLLIHPIFLRHFFIETATVSHIAKNSPISNLLPIHSTIESIDGCLIHTSKDWYQCLRSIRDKHSLQSSGYCLTQAEIQLLSSHIGGK